MSLVFIHGLIGVLLLLQQQKGKPWSSPLQSRIHTEGKYMEQRRVKNDKTENLTIPFTEQIKK